MLHLSGDFARSTSRSPHWPQRFQANLKGARAAFLAVLIASALIAAPCGAAGAQADQSAAAACCGQPGQPKAGPLREIVFPYYSLRDGFNSTLYLVSASTKPLDLTVVIYSLSGERLIGPTMAIPALQRITLDFGAVLGSLNMDADGPFGEGSIAVRFQGMGVPLVGQVSVSNPERRLSFESEMVDTSPGLFNLRQRLNALWWGLGGGKDARIMLNNTSDAPAGADLFIDFLGKRHPLAPLKFAAHETKVLSISQMLSGLDVSPAEAPEGGITIIPSGPTPTLAAQGRIFDPSTGLSTTRNFLDSSLQLSNVMYIGGLPIGTPPGNSPYAGGGSFTPHVIARNLLGTAQTVLITVQYPKIAGWDATHFRKLPDGSASTAKDFTGEMALAPLALGPYSTVDFSLEPVMSQLPLPLPYASLRVQHSGPAGSAIAEAASIEARGDLVLESRVENLGDAWSGLGANPWHLDAQTNAVLFLSNQGEEECPIGFRVDTPGGSYFLTQVTIKPHETRSIDIRKLRDAQEPDFKGNLIPVGASDGSVKWIRLSNQPVSGRLVILRQKP